MTSIASIRSRVFARFACAAFFAFAVSSLHAQTHLSGSYNNQSITGDVVIDPGVTASFSSGTTFSGANAGLGDASTLNWNQNGTLVGKVFTFGSGGSATLNVGAGFALTLDSATSLTGGIILSGAISSSIVNQGAVIHNAGAGYIYGPAVSNASGGTITAVAGSTLSIGLWPTDAFANAAGGLVEADGAGSVITLLAVFNQGTISATNGGLIDFAGDTMTTADLGTVQLSNGGRVQLSGTINNESDTLVAPTGGTFELAGGFIIGGTVAADALTFTSTGGLLDHVLYNGDLIIAPNAQVSVTDTNGHSSVAGTNIVMNNGSLLVWSQDDTFVAKHITSGAGGVSAQFVAVGSIVTFDANTNFSGSLNLSGQAGGAIINYGAINQTSGPGLIYGDSFTNGNGGNVQAISFGTTLQIGVNPTDVMTNQAGGIIQASLGAEITLLNVINQGTYVADSGVFHVIGANNTTANLGSTTLLNGGRILIEGVVDNSAQTLTAPTGGTYELSGGEIDHGTIGPGALSFTSSNGTLNAVTINDNLVVADNAVGTFSGGTTFTGSSATVGAMAHLYWDQNGTLTGKALNFGGPDDSGRITVDVNYSLTFGAGTTAGGIMEIVGATGATFINQGSILTTHGTSYIYGDSMTNASGGTITATGGSFIFFGYGSGETITNASGGTLTADGASSTVFLRNVINQGTVRALNGGIVAIDGPDNITAHLGTIQLVNGGIARITGMLDNTSASLSAPTGGTYQLAGGHIIGGSVDANAISFSPTPGVLDGVGILGDLNIGDGNNTVYFTNGTVFSGTNAYIGEGSTLILTQDGTLSNHTITFGSATAPGTISVGASDTLIIDSTTTLIGNMVLYVGVGGSITNQGLINHTTVYSTIYGNTFVNASGGVVMATGGSTLAIGFDDGEYMLNDVGGTLIATGTNSTLRLHNFLNLGSIQADNNGAIAFIGTYATADIGDVQTASGGRVFLEGALDNTAASLSTFTGGHFELNGGHITGGSIDPGALTFTNLGGILSGVDFLGDFALSGNAIVQVDGGTTIGGTNLSFANNGTLNWQQTGTLDNKLMSFAANGAIFLNATNASLTIGVTSSATGAVHFTADASTGTYLLNQGSITNTTGTGELYARTFRNEGSITQSGGSLSLGSISPGFSTVNAAGGLITVISGTASVLSPLSNQGTINVQGGTLVTGVNLSNDSGGRIQGNGIIDGSLTMAGGTLAPGNSIGTLTVANGTFAVTGPATFAVELGGTASDQLLFTNPASMIDIGAGLLTLDLTLVAAPDMSTTFTIMGTSGGPNTFGSGRFAGLMNSGDTFSVSYMATNYDFEINYLSTGITLNFTPVPEPSTYALLGLGLLALGLRRKR